MRNMSNRMVASGTLVVWVSGFVALYIAKHTLLASTWGSRDISLHWRYWAAQAIWTVLIWGGSSFVAKLRASQAEQRRSRDSMLK
jgi:hypothetical protein